MNSVDGKSYVELYEPYKLELSSENFIVDNASSDDSEE